MFDMMKGEKKWIKFEEGCEESLLFTDNYIVGGKKNRGVYEKRKMRVKSFKENEK